MIENEMKMEIKRLKHVMPINITITILGHYNHVFEYPIANFFYFGQTLTASIKSKSKFDVIYITILFECKLSY